MCVRIRELNTLKKKIVKYLKRSKYSVARNKKWKLQVFYFILLITTSRLFGSYLILKFKTLYNSSYLLMPNSSYIVLISYPKSIFWTHWPESKLKQASLWSAGERITALLIHNQSDNPLTLSNEKEKRPRRLSRGSCTTCHVSLLR